MHIRRALTPLLCLAAVSCADAPQPGTRGGDGIAITIAPLDLQGVTNADWRLTVTNGDSALVWTRDISADAFGDGTGSVSYVGTCDGDAPLTTVTLELLALYDGVAGTTAIPQGDYVNPGPMSREVTCLPNQDVPVSFNVTIARRAQQGFFDVAVSFEDVHCSAKLDCVDDLGQPLRLLHAPGGERGETIVLGFACSAGQGATATHLYLNQLVVTCGANTATVDPSGGPGNVAAADVVESGADLLFGAAVYRGAEQLGFATRYWNVALGFNGGNDCVLTTRGTASEGALTAFTTDADTTWPVIDWDVTLTGPTGTLLCSTHAIDGGDGVATEYTSLGTGEAFGFEYGPGGAAASVHGIRLQGDGRVFDDGTVGATCDAYRHPAPGYAYSGAIGDGIYTIDPDGAGAGLPPFDVTCDMQTDGGGWVVVGHDQVGNLIPNKAVEVPTTLYQRFDYALSNAQLLAIMAATSTHRQYFEKNCRDSLINSEWGTSYTRYELPDGNLVSSTVSLFPWAPSRLGCDINDQVDRQTALTFENTANIPIMALWGGDSGDPSEFSTFRLGPYLAR